MDLTALTALSPLDGRYAAKLDALRPHMGELGYMRYRVQVELTWFVALSDAGFAEFPPLSAAAIACSRSRSASSASILSRDGVSTAMRSIALR